MMSLTEFLYLKLWSPIRQIWFVPLGTMHKTDSTWFTHWQIIFICNAQTSQKKTTRRSYCVHLWEREKKKRSPKPKHNLNLFRKTWSWSRTWEAAASHCLPSWDISANLTESDLWPDRHKILHNLIKIHPHTHRGTFSYVSCVVIATSDAVQMCRRRAETRVTNQI